MIPSVYPHFCLYLRYYWGFPGSSAGKESTCNAENPGLILGSGKFPGEGMDYPFQYSWASLVAQMVKNPPARWKTWVRSLGWEDSWRRAWQPPPVFLENLVGRGVWQTTVHRVTQSWTRLKWLSRQAGKRNKNFDVYSSLTDLHEKEVKKPIGLCSWVVRCGSHMWGIVSILHLVHTFLRLSR